MLGFFVKGTFYFTVLYQKCIFNILKWSAVNMHSAANIQGDQLYMAVHL